MTRVVCIGECMVELSRGADGRYHRAFAGDAYNTAVYLKRGAPDLEVQFATVTGDDALSAAMRAAWDAEGIDAALASTVPGATPGLYLIDTDGLGERRFTYWRGQSPARRWLPALEAAAGAIAGADLVYLSGISLAILPPDQRPRAIEFIRALGARIAFDPNVRPALWESAQAMRVITAAAIAAAAIVLPSLDDAEALWGGRDPEAHIAHLFALGAEEVALTLGPPGCVVADAQGPAQTIAAPPASAIDTSGAGDAFNGAYLAARLASAPASDAARAGLALAARVVGHRGALTPPSGARP
jgi:2-dehydro-3-deoxygluconokinase